MKMNPTRLLATVLGIALVACTAPADPASPATSGNPAPTAEKGMAPKVLAGSRLHYSDLHSRNTYTFKTDGKFVFDYVHHGSGDSGGRDGGYRYRVTAPAKARVDFNDGDFMLMEFDSPLSGTCVFDGDVRRYGFTITRPDGE
jgi:hypothetical protein